MPFQRKPDYILHDRDDLEHELGGRRALLLSANVPSAMDERESLEIEPSKWEAWENSRKSTPIYPARIRDAVSALARAALTHNYRIVCHAHPSVTPMLLQVASDMGARKGSVIVFASEFDLNHDAVSPLCNWSAGILVGTPNNRLSFNARGHAPAMRELMVRTPGMQGAVFIGGRRDVQFDADAFQAAHPSAKCYAIESTGSAAAALAGRPQSNFHGDLDRDLLRDSRSYSLIAHRIILDLRRGYSDGAPEVFSNVFL